MAKFILTAIGLLLAILTLFIGLLFWDRASLNYNSEGNYFDGAVVYHEQSVMVYGILTFLFSAFTMLAGYFALGKYKDNAAN